MSFRFTALQLDISEDLQPLSAVLYQRGVAHRIYEESGRQVLKVDSESHIGEVVALYEGWRNGEFRIERVEVSPDHTDGSAVESSSRSLQEAPVTIVLMVLCLIGFGLWYFRQYEWLELLTFSSMMATAANGPAEALTGQYWRLITPAFLHLGWLHIAFNSLWLWELGSKLERQIGSINVFLLFCTIAIVSNVGQFLFGGPGLFGGMSGVVYGLLGFSWIGPQIQTQWHFQPPRPIMIFMVAWLVFCMTGFTEVLGIGAVANAAHVGGLIIGVLLGAAFATLSRMTEDKI
ncbi:MAG: rhomboid family intramembrane serine protease [Halioglobus sp.]